MHLNSKAAISEEVVCRDLGEELVLLHLESGFYFGLNAAGFEIWQLLEEGGHTFADIAARLADKFGIRQQEAEADVLTLAEDMLEHGLIHEQTT